jgi:hypothetical protein
MGLFDWFANLFTQEAKHYVYAPVASDATKIVFQEGQQYFRLRLAEMFLKDDRKLFRRMVPVVSSLVGIQFGSDASRQLPNVAGPTALQLSEASLGRGVQLNYALTNLVPYRGGTVSISAALLSCVSKDYLSDFLSLANQVAGLLTIGQLSAALQVAGSVMTALQDLLDSGDKEVRLVYHNSYGGADELGGVSLTSGYFAVIGAETGQLDTAKLYVRNSRLCYGNDALTAQPLTGYDYMLFSVEAAFARDDFRYFTEYNRLLYAAIEKGMTDRTEGDAVIRAGMLAIFQSDDLTYVDKTRVAAALKAEYEDRLSLKDGLPQRQNHPEEQWLQKRALAISADYVQEILQPLLRDTPGQENETETQLMRLIEQDVFKIAKL